jgi:hypothetical protein
MGTITYVDKNREKPFKANFLEPKNSLHGTSSGGLKIRNLCNTRVPETPLKGDNTLDLGEP